MIYTTRYVVRARVSHFSFCPAPHTTFQIASPIQLLARRKDESAGTSPHAFGHQTDQILIIKIIPKRLTIYKYR